MIAVFMMAACCGASSENNGSFHDPSKRQNQSPFPSRHRNHGSSIIAGSSRGFSRDRDDDSIWVFQVLKKFEIKYFNAWWSLVEKNPLFKLWISGILNLSKIQYFASLNSWVKRGSLTQKCYFRSTSGQIFLQNFFCWDRDRYVTLKFETVC